MLSLYSVLSIFLYASYAYLYFWSVNISPVKPLHWYIISIIGGVLLVATHRACWFPHPRVARLLVWAVVFVAVVAASYFFSSQQEAALQVVINYYESAALLVTMVLLFQPEEVARRAVAALFLVVIFAIGMNFVDFFSSETMAFSKVAGRAAGFYVNPTISGKFLVFGMVLSQSVLPRMFRFPFCLSVGIGVLLTFSRASILLWGIAILALSWSEAFVLPRLRSLAIVSCLLFALGSSLVGGLWVGAFEIIGVGDRLNENTASRIGKGFIEQEDRSSQDRVLVAKAGLRLFLAAPVFGHGVGATRVWDSRVSTHNMYLLLGAEQGIVGILLIIWLLWVLWRQGSVEGRIVAILYFVSGFFTHNNLEQPAMQVVLALAIVGVTGLESDRTTKKASGRQSPPLTTRVPG